MANQHTENKFKAIIGLLAATGMFLATGGAAGSALAGVVASLSGEVAGEKLDYFIQKAYEVIGKKGEIKEPLEKAMAKAIANAVVSLEKEYLDSDPTLTKKDKKNIKDFLQLFASTAPTFTDTYLQTAAYSDLLNFARKSPAAIDSAIQQLTNQQEFVDYFTKELQLPTAFATYFTENLGEQFSHQLKQMLTEGGPAKNALDLLYQQIFREQLEALLAKADSHIDQLNTLAAAVNQLAATKPTDTLAQQLATALKKVLVAQQDDLLEHINKQPPLEYNYAGLDDNEAVYRRRYLDFIVQEAAWQQLVDFYNSPNPFEWWLVTGTAGTGKSRLALEFCLALHQYGQQPVCAGFIVQANVQTYNWSNTPVRPWLIVIDYAAARKADIEKIMTAMREKAANNKLQHPVRLLLLERSTPSDWWDAQAQKLHLPIQGGAIPPYQPAPLELGLVGEKEKVSFAAAIFTATLAKLGITATDDELRSYLESVYKIDRQLRPLFVFFCARAVADGKDIRQWNTNNLMHYWLERHEKPRWRQLLLQGSYDEALLQPWLNLLAIVTMSYGLTEEQAAHLYKTSREILPQPPATAAKYYQQYLGGIDNKVWRPLEPDVLGEYFVQQHLQTTDSNIFEKTEKEALQQHLIAIAWQIEPQGMLAFCARYFQDYGEDAVFRSFTAGAAEQSKITELSSLLFFITNEYSDKGELANAENKYALLQALATNNLQNPEVVTALAMASVNLAPYYFEKGEPEKAENKYTLLQALAKKHPKYPEVVTALAKASFNLVNYYSEEDEPEKAEDKYTLLRALAEDNTQNTEVVTKLADASFNLVYYYSEKNEPEKAEDKYTLLQALAKKHPQYPEVVTALAKASVNLANYYSEKNVPEKAEEKYTLLQALGAQYSRNPEAVTALAKASFNLTNYYSEKGELEKAEEKYTLLQALAAQHSRNPEAVTALVKASFNLANYYSEKGELEKAEEKYIMLQALAAQHSRNPEAVTALANASFNLAYYYFKKGELEKAEEKYIMLQALAEKHPQYPEIVTKLADASFNLVNYYSEIDEPQKAEDKYTLLWALAEKYPQYPEIVTKFVEASLLLFNDNLQQQALQAALEKWSIVLRIDVSALSPEGLATFSDMGTALVIELFKMLQQEYDENLVSVWLATLQVLVAIGPMSDEESVQHNTAWAQSILDKLPKNDEQSG